MTVYVKQIGKLRWAQLTGSPLLQDKLSAHFNPGNGGSYTNPTDWLDKSPDRFPDMCAGYAQSPNDIVPCEAVPLRKGVGFKAKLSTGPHYSPDGKYNNGHTGMVAYLTSIPSSLNQHKTRQPK